VPRFKITGARPPQLNVGGPVPPFPRGSYSPEQFN